MEHINKVSARIIELLPGASHKMDGTAGNILTFTIQFTRLCKNIKDTSFNELDRMDRCQRLSEDSGIDLHYIKELTS